jgi:hypothetical protein
MNSNTDDNMSILLTLGDNGDCVRVCTVHLVTPGLLSYMNTAVGVVVKTLDG